MTKTFQARPLLKTEIELSKFQVDILVPFHGQYQKIYRLLHSIWMGTKSNPYQIYLIDDCSPNENFIHGFEKAPHTKIVQNTQQLGFGGSLSAGFNESLNNTKSQFIVFLHSDCYIEDPNWLAELLRTYMVLQKEKVGLVVARTNNPGHETNPLLKATSREKSRDSVVKEGYLPLYCGLCEKDLFKNIKGFIKSYPYGYYEDQELAYRMRRFGINQGISGRSWVHHDDGATFNTLLKKNPKISDIIDENRDRCLADLRNL